MACDFCGSPKHNWTYATKPFLFEVGPGTIIRCRGEWRACDACKPHIDAGNFERVLDRLEAGRKEEGQEISPSGRATVKGCLDEFVLHREGEAIKYEEPRPHITRVFAVPGNELVN